MTALFDRCINYPLPVYFRSSSNFSTYVGVSNERFMASGSVFFFFEEEL